jgi:hypothetical protein
MTKEELLALLRSAGVDENTVTFASNVYDIGYDYAKDEAFKQGFILKEQNEKSN